MPSKYDPLRLHLAGRPPGEFTIRFDEIGTHAEYDDLSIEDV